MKYFLIALIGILFISCSKTSKENNPSEGQLENESYDAQQKSKINELKNSKRSQWKRENWYRAKDGDWNGNYLGWFRHVIQISSDNSIGMLLGKPLYPVFILESYKKELTKESKTERILHLTILGNKKNVDSIIIQFDDDALEIYDAVTKHNIEIHFSKKDIAEIIDRLKNAETFTILFEEKTIYFNNKDFNKYFE